MVRGAVAGTIRRSRSSRSRAPRSRTRPGSKARPSSTPRSSASSQKCLCRASPWTTTTAEKFVGFFSYAHSDAAIDPALFEATSSELEKRVDANIVNATFEIWRDNKKLRTGDYWEDDIQKAIRSADVMVLLLTPKWVSSDYCRREFGSFKEQEADRGNGSFVIPIYARNIDTQLHDLSPGQMVVHDDLMRRQHKRISPTELGLHSEGQRVELIERIADDIVLVSSRRRTGEPARPRPVQAVGSPTTFAWTVLAASVPRPAATSEASDPPKRRYGYKVISDGYNNLSILMQYQRLSDVC
jgi:hypothetical protein